MNSCSLIKWLLLGCVACSLMHLVARPPTSGDQEQPDFQTGTGAIALVPLFLLLLLLFLNKKERKEEKKRRKEEGGRKKGTRKKERFEKRFCLLLSDFF